MHIAAFLLPLHVVKTLNLKQTQHSRTWKCFVPVRDCDRRCGGSLLNAGTSTPRLPHVTGDTFFVLLQPCSFRTALASVFIEGVATLRSVKGDYFICSGSPSGASSHRAGSFDNTKKENSPLWSFCWIGWAIDALCSHMSSQRSPWGSWKDSNIIT